MMILGGADVASRKKPFEEKIPCMINHMQEISTVYSERFVLLYRRNNVNAVVHINTMGT